MTITEAGVATGAFAVLAEQLAKLDRRITRRVAALRDRDRGGAGLDARTHLYVTDDEVDRLLAGWTADRVTGAVDDDWPVSELQPPLLDLAVLFGLGPFELRAVVVCLAPELDRKYDRLYAYLQDDVTRKRPSVDLVLDLLCPTSEDRWRERVHLAPDAPLRRGGVLRTVDDPGNPSGVSDLGTFLRVDERIRWYLNGHDTVDPGVADVVSVRRPARGLDDVLVEPELKARLLAEVTGHLGDHGTGARRLIVGLHGPAGSGRRWLAEGICAELGWSLTFVDARRWAGDDPRLPELLRLAFRECLLHQGAIYLDGLDALVHDDEGLAARVLAVVGRAAVEFSMLTFLGTEAPLRLDDPPGDAVFRPVAVPRPGAALRELAWRRALARTVPSADLAWAPELAGQFSLTLRQITDAVNDARIRARATPAAPGLPDLRSACRRQGRHRLGDLAVRVDVRRSWSELTLPPDQLAQLQELCAEYRHRGLVFDEWGLGRVVGSARGLSALLVGVPGTGKTMAAEVLAGELGVDLFAVDLAGVVSKYVGETEKNLSRVFQAAEHSNAILFFDEADALFGKRTEVSDAHDRYANIETSYLLQRMERYDGVVVLATNLRENMDEAFTRRLRFIVDFPFPDEASRAAIWRTHLPAGALVGGDVDAAALARRYPLTGAGIRNAALTAAFAAAADGTAIGQHHVRHGIRREYEKLGQLWSEPVPVRPATSVAGEESP